MNSNFIEPPESASFAGKQPWGLSRAEAFREVVHVDWYAVGLDPLTQTTIYKTLDGQIATCGKHRSTYRATNKATSTGGDGGGPGAGKDSDSHPDEEQD